jgi:hypothetical protein
MALTLKKSSGKEGSGKGREGKGAARPPKPPKTGGGKKQRFTLIIGDEGTILIYMQGAKVVRRLFAPSPQPTHTEAMVELMRAHPKVPVLLLADVLDQQYIRQTFPPVAAMSVKGLVTRRLDRDFQAEDLKGSLPLGRDKTGRKEWNFLLIALVRTPLMQAWLDLVVELPNELKGIYLVPVEAQIYLETLRATITSDKPKPWQLLVSHNKISGFRQIVVREGKLVFTRVTQAIDDAIPAVIAGNIEQEILNTLEYLRRLGFQENNGLEALLVVSQDVHDALDLKRFGFAGAHVLTPLDVADALGLEQAALSADRFGDVVMAAAFSRAKKRILHLSTPYADKLAMLYKVRKGVIALAAVAGLALGVMSVMNIVTASGDSAAVDAVEAKRSGLQQQLAQLKKIIAGLNHDVAFKSAVVTTYDDYVKPMQDPVDFAGELSSFLSGEQRVRSFEWGASGTMTGGEGTGGTQAVATPASTSSNIGALTETRVEIEFMGQYADTEALTRSTNLFLANLKNKMPDYDITHDAFPWLSDSQKNLEISFDQQYVASPIKEGQNRLVLHFKGPKKAGAAAAPVAGSPSMLPTARPDGDAP